MKITQEEEQRMKNEKVERERIEMIKAFAQTLDPKCELAEWINSLLVALEAAQQTIARKREALEPEKRKSIIDHCSDVNHYDDYIFSPPTCIEELPEPDKAEVMEWLSILLGACAESVVESVTDVL